MVGTHTLNRTSTSCIKLRRPCFHSLSLAQDAAPPAGKHPEKSVRCVYHYNKHEFRPKVPVCAQNRWKMWAEATPPRGLASRGPDLPEAWLPRERPSSPNVGNRPRGLFVAPTH